MHGLSSHQRPTQTTGHILTLAWTPDGRVLCKLRGALRPIDPMSDVGRRTGPVDGVTHRAFPVPIAEERHFIYGKCFR